MTPYTFVRGFLLLACFYKWRINNKGEPFLEYMKLALSLARATQGQTSPNPNVGAVVVKDGEIIGTGVHLKAGNPHAEVHAIRQAGENARGAELYVTLEPCSHHGRTPPCTDLIIEAGIKKVYIACTDPNPLVAGKGIKKLQQAGIEVETGICEEEALKINEKFFHYIKTNTPFVTLKAAVTLDGKIAAKTGDSKWITSPEARQDVHTLRHEHDAILVGINTVLHDNPLLTTRRPQGGKHPVRIILDTRLQIPLDAKILQDKSTKTIIFTGRGADEDKVQAVRDLGAEVISLETERISVRNVLQILGKKKITSLLVEGGSEIHASFIEAGAVQQMIIYVAPKVVGGKTAVTFVGGTGFDRIAEGLQLKFTDVEHIGPDIKITAKPIRKEEDACSPES